MNNREMNDEDLLRKFLGPEKIERAPAGFTAKTITRIRIETRSARVDKGFFAKYRVPVISSIITAGLIIAAIMIPAGETESIGSTIWRNILDLEFTLPAINNNYFNNFSLPGWFGYAVIGILLLGFFDRALSGIFHKEKNP